MAIKNENEAKRILELLGQLTDEIKRLRKESNLDELEKQLEEGRHQLAEWMYENSIDELESNFYKTPLTKRREYWWALTKSDIPKELYEESKSEGKKRKKPLSLTFILGQVFGSGEEFEEVMNRITRRVVIPEALQELANDAEIDAETLARAYISREKTYYVQVTSKASTNEKGKVAPNKSSRRKD